MALIFKKLDENRRARNHVSQQIEDYRHQRNIAGIPAVVKLIAGYLEDEETGEITGIYVTRPSGGVNRWEWLITNDFAAPATTQPLFEDEDEIEDADIIPRTEPGKVIPLERGKKDGENQS